MRVRVAAWSVLVLARIAVAEPTIAMAEPTLAVAGPTIVLVETRGAPSLPALASQVELHTGRRASVQTLAARGADPMTYADRASQLVASGDATIVVWIAPVDRGFLVFAAGSWPGRALVELVRVDDDLGPAELERTIALKLAGLLDAALAPGVTPRAALAIAGGPRPSRWRIEVGGAVAHESRQRGFDGRAALAASRTWARGSWRFAPTLAGYWQPTGAIEGNGGRASVTELGAVAALEAGLEVGSIEVFARPRLVAAVLAARGTSGDGRRGEATVGAPYAGVELGLRRAVSEALWLGIATGCDVALIRNTLLIDRETIVDLGRIRLHVGVSLTMSL
jgi:hypothetical protein